MLRWRWRGGWRVVCGDGDDLKAHHQPFLAKNTLLGLAAFEFLVFVVFSAEC